MRQYSIDIFDRNLTFKYHDFANSVPKIDDDYLSLVTNSLETGSTDRISVGDFIRIESTDINYFGVVTDATPGDKITTVQFRSLLSIFDTDFLFDTNDQKKTNDQNARTLESEIAHYLVEIFEASDDPSQNYSVFSISAVTNSVTKWGFNITPDTEGSHYSIIGLHSVLLARALKQYGVAINVSPHFNAKRIDISIGVVHSKFTIDADLDSVDVTALKVNDRPNGTNKLIIYNTYDYLESAVFYVYTDRTWGMDKTTKRIVPVVREVRGVQPYEDEEIDPEDAFPMAAVDTAYDTLSGLEWDNLIELETMSNDPLIEPLNLKFGQQITMRYKNGTYTSILTGKAFDGNVVKLIFGSERITFTKRTR